MAYIPVRITCAACGDPVGQFLPGEIGAGKRPTPRMPVYCHICHSAACRAGDHTPRLIGGKQ